MARARLKGMSKVTRNLAKEIGKIKDASVDGLYEAGLLVQRRALKKTPIDQGNLRGSSRVDVDGASSYKPRVIVHYLAKYAVYVHEIKKNYKAPGTGWKFLERAVLESKKQILQIIRRRAKI